MGLVQRILLSSTLFAFSVLPVSCSTKNIRPNLPGINQEVISTAQKYFENIDFDGLQISYTNRHWQRSHSLSDGTIIIGLGKNNEERYRLIITHEYAHYLLHKIGLGSRTSEEYNLHQGIVDVYTLFLNREEQGKLWGKKNEKRIFPYNIFSNRILEEDNFDCLYSVFDEDDKIENVPEILKRLKEWCGVEYRGDS